MMRLSQDQLDFFDREGYLVVEDVLTDADLQPVINEITAKIDEISKKLVAEGALSRDYAEEDFEHRLAKISRETDAVHNAIWSGTLSGPAFFDLIRHDTLLDVAEQFCGPELIASSVYRLRPKVPSYHRSPVPWHQDSGYFEPYCDDALVLTMWIPLVDANETNGCLWVIPRAHKGAVVRHVNIEGKPYLHILDEDLPRTCEPVCAEVRKGGVLLLSNKTPHASFENNTDAVRYSMDLRYQSAKLPTNAPISRLEGEIIGVEGGEVPIACYPPEADFLVRSKARPHEVVTDPATFHRIRSEHQGAGLSRRWETLPANA